MIIQEYLEQTIENWNRVGHPAIQERFILRNGKAFTPIPLTGERRTPKECFANATRYVMDQGEGTYVEGYAWREDFPLLIHHAWVGFDDQAMDPTLERPEECQFFGVEFDFDVLLGQLVTNEYYGLLDGSTGINWKFMLEFDPGMIEFLPKQMR